MAKKETIIVQGWERMNNPDFNLTGFRKVKMLSTETGFHLSSRLP
jgi:hypothetical protein